MKQYVFHVSYGGEITKTSFSACKLHTALHRLGECVEDKAGLKIHLVRVWRVKKANWVKA